MHACRPGDPAVARVVSNERCTASAKSAGFVRHVEIDVSGTPLEGVCLAGQSIGVLAPGEDERGKPHRVRLYSLASPSAGEDGAGRVISTTVKRTIDEHWETGGLFLGVASNYLCDLRPGDEVRVSGPNGKRFLLPVDQGAHDYVFFSTGTGIAPFRGFVKELLAGGGSHRVTLVSGAAYSTDLLYHDEFVAMASAYPDRFTYLTAVSREENGGEGRLYVGDRLRTHASHFRGLLGGERALVYVCGVLGMESGVLRGMVDLLGPEGVRGYLGAPTEVLLDDATWRGGGVARAVRPTGRVMLEVYA